MKGGARMLVIGKRLGTFKDKDTGEIVSYGRLYVTYPFDLVDGKVPDGCEGQRVEEVKAPVDALADVQIGDTVEPVYNKYGRVQAVIVKEHTKKTA